MLYFGSAGRFRVKVVPIRDFIFGIARYETVELIGNHNQVKPRQVQTTRRCSPRRKLIFLLKQKRIQIIVAQRPPQCS